MASPNARINAINELNRFIKELIGKNVAKCRFRNINNAYNVDERECTLDELETSLKSIDKFVEYHEILRESLLKSDNNIEEINDGIEKLDDYDCIDREDCINNINCNDVGNRYIKFLSSNIKPDVNLMAKEELEGYRFFPQILSMYGEYYREDKPIKKVISYVYNESIQPFKQKSLLSVAGNTVTLYENFGHFLFHGHEGNYEVELHFDK